MGAIFKGVVVVKWLGHPTFDMIIRGWWFGPVLCMHSVVCSDKKNFTLLHIGALSPSTWVNKWVPVNCYGNLSK